LQIWTKVNDRSSGHEEKERQNPREIEGKQTLFSVNVEPRNHGKISEPMPFDSGYADETRPIPAVT
jgi:tRNA-binding protein